ncbi:MAG TPA: hypothetical protein VG370_26405 [Chloroflexota bacterium]|nr:hypothetical protein [Chloroflexota bacterium]
MTPEQPSPYATPAAFRRALTDKLRAVAAPKGRWPRADLQRQFAYDRLLSRLYLLDAGWIVKGAAALLARGVAVRHTVDVDVYRATGLARAERDLRSAAARDLGAIAWYLKAVGWEIPDFTVDRYAEPLLRLHREMERTGQPIDVGFHVFLLVAEKP